MIPMLTTRQRYTFEAVLRERAYQDAKWGTIEEHPHDVSGWLLIMRKELNEAMDAWASSAGDSEALKEILQVVAVGVAAMEQWGVIERDTPPSAPPNRITGAATWER